MLWLHIVQGKQSFVELFSFFILQSRQWMTSKSEWVQKLYSLQNSNWFYKFKMNAKLFQTFNCNWEKTSFFVFCSDIRKKNGIYMLGVVFFVQSIFADRNNIFWQTIFKTHWRYQLPEFKCKKIFYLQSFFVKFWGFENCQFGNILRAFEEFVYNAESVPRIIYARRIIPHNKIVPNWNEAS